VRFSVIFQTPLGLGALICHHFLSSAWARCTGPKITAVSWKLHTQHHFFSSYCSIKFAIDNEKKVIYLLLEINFKDMPILFLCQHATQNFYSIIMHILHSITKKKSVIHLLLEINDRPFLFLSACNTECLFILQILQSIIKKKLLIYLLFRDQLRRQAISRLFLCTDKWQNRSLSATIRTQQYIYRRLLRLLAKGR
jgi:hypothetical protein